MSIVSTLRHPTMEEIRNHSSDADIEPGLFTFYGVVTLTVEFGNESIGDCPYNPTLCSVMPDVSPLGNVLTIQSLEGNTMFLSTYYRTIAASYSSFASNEMHSRAFAKWIISLTKKPAEIDMSRKL